MGLPRRLLGEDEILVLLLRRHVKVLVGPLLVLLGCAVAVGLLAGYLSDDVGGRSWAAIAGLAGAVLLRWAGWPFFRWWHAIYGITNRRLILREGVLSRRGHDMPLSRLSDVSLSRTLWQRALGCGTLVVESGGEHGQLRLVDIPKVELVQRTLYRLSEEAYDPDDDEQEFDPDQVDDSEDALPGGSRWFAEPPRSRRPARRHER